MLLARLACPGSARLAYWLICQAGLLALAYLSIAVGTLTTALQTDRVAERANMLIQ
jgi:hypothetical protein